MSAKPKILIVTGPTAAGKSAFIYEYLRHLPLKIINADSRQVYKDLVICSAAPADHEKKIFPHALYNFLALTESFSAGEFMRRARLEIAAALSEGRVPLLCGGTYFYLHALFVGLLPEVVIPDGIRKVVEEMPAAEAYARLVQIDSAAAEKIHLHNDRRMRRALMLCLVHGHPISQMAREGGILDEYDVLMLVFDMDKLALQNRVRERVAGMFRAGIVAEAQSLFGALEVHELNHWSSIPALTGIGVREFFEIYAQTGKKPATLTVTELGNVEERIAQNTIHLVKRQRTWIRNAQPRPANTKTVDPSYENTQIASLIKDFLN